MCVFSLYKSHEDKIAEFLFIPPCQIKPLKQHRIGFRLPKIRQKLHNCTVGSLCQNKCKCHCKPALVTKCTASSEHKKHKEVAHLLKSEGGGRGLKGVKVTDY